MCFGVYIKHATPVEVRGQLVRAFSFCQVDPRDRIWVKFRGKCLCPAGHHASLGEWLQQRTWEQGMDSKPSFTLSLTNQGQNRLGTDSVGKVQVMRA